VAEKTKARFIEPMLLLRTEKLPEGPDWVVELKLDGYRALAIKADDSCARRPAGISRAFPAGFTTSASSRL